MSRFHSVVPLVVIGWTIAINTAAVQAQSFRSLVFPPNPVAPPVFVNNYFAPRPIGINLNNRGLSPAASQYLQATRNNIAVANAATRLVNSRAPSFPTYRPAADYAYSAAYAGWNAPWYGNPYWNGFYNPYWSSYPPMVGMPYGYGMNYGYSAGYSMDHGNAQNAAVPNVPAPQAPRVQPAVATFGVPTNDDGSIAWPFAFRLMPPDKKRELLDPLAAQLEIASTQASKGKVNQNMLRENQKSVERLYQWLRTHRLDLAEGSYREANEFLGRIDTALRAMRPDM